MKYRMNAFHGQATSTSFFNVPEHARQLPHRVPGNVRDKLAYLFVRFLRFFADVFLPDAMAIVPSFWKPSPRSQAWSAVRSSI
jgi:hypothetical protein